MAPEAGTATFNADPIGRYSGLADYVTRPVGEPITVTCDAINVDLRRVVAAEGRIDLLKIDGGLAGKRCFWPDTPAWLAGKVA